MFFKANKSINWQKLWMILIFLMLISGSYWMSTKLVGKAINDPSKDIGLKSSNKTVQLVSPEGYRTAAANGTYFFAAGTKGRIDKITLDKKTTRVPVPTKVDLNDICIENGITVVVGMNGVILSSRDGEAFKVSNTGIDFTIFEVAYFNGKFVASSEKGVILTSRDGLLWDKYQLDTDKNIIGIAANTQRIMAITRESDIFISSDMNKWQEKNFNGYYKASYDPCIFGKISVVENTFFISGQQEKNPSIPFVMYSDDNEFWTFTPFDKIDDKEIDDKFNLKINGVARNVDELVAVCDNGKLLTITSCSVCNKLSDIQTADLNDLASIDGKLLVVGDNFTFDLVDNITIRQFNIQPEQAKNDIDNGAFIVDVRTKEEFDELHITGAVNIPVNQIEDKLIKTIPDTDAQIIFYCAKGVRAQTALEKALSLGYKKVNNLGSIKDWPYEAEASQ